MQCKIQKISFKLSFVTKIRTLVCVGILYVAFNNVLLIMKSLINTWIFPQNLTVCKAFHDQMHHVESFIEDFRANQCSYLGHKWNSKCNFFLFYIAQWGFKGFHELVWVVSNDEWFQKPYVWLYFGHKRKNMLSFVSERNFWVDIPVERCVQS